MLKLSKTALVRKLHRWELDHLRQHAAELQAQTQHLQGRLASAEDSAEYWSAQLLRLEESLEGARLGITIEGELSIIPDAAPAARNPQG